MDLKLTDLKRGTTWWQTNTKWPRDFHNAVYHELYDLRRNGLSKIWWKSTVDRLATWQAIRPYSREEVRRRGSQLLADLRRFYRRVVNYSQVEPSILEFSWDQLRAFFDKLSRLKGPHTPVFASKLGHFIFPKLFIIKDQKATGTEDYEAYRNNMKAAWIDFRSKQRAKEILLGEISRHSSLPLHPNYLFENKIIELCRIGQRHTRFHHAAVNNDQHQRVALVHQGRRPNSRGNVMDKFDKSFSCNQCRFSISRLKEMAELGGTKEMFTTFAGNNLMNIYKVDSEKGYIRMSMKTG